MGCSKCICRNCLMWWSSSCPHGECYDDYRAKFLPRTKQIGQSIRKLWTDWSKNGEQDHWCRGGITKPLERNTNDMFGCYAYVPYEGQKVHTCLKANVSVFQDGYIECSLLKNYGCEACYRDFLSKEGERE